MSVAPVAVEPTAGLFITSEPGVAPLEGVIELIVVPEARLFPVIVFPTINPVVSGMLEIVVLADVAFPEKETPVVNVATPVVGVVPAILPVTEAIVVA